MTALVPSEMASLAISPGKTRRQPWPGGWKKPRRRGERRGGEDIPPERSPVRRRRGVGRRRLGEALDDGVLERSRAAASANPRAFFFLRKKILEPSEPRGNKWIEGRVPNGPTGVSEDSGPREVNPLENPFNPRQTNEALGVKYSPLLVQQELTV